MFAFFFFLKKKKSYKSFYFIWSNPYNKNMDYKK